MYATALKWLALIGGVVLLIGAIFFLGSKHGEAKITAQWQAEKIEYSREVNRQQEVIRTKEADHAAAQSQLQSQVAEQARLHEVALASVRAEYSQRLRTSEVRAGVYQRQAEAGPDSCRSLAAYAAQLDGSLEQGRSLVQELRLTVGQRDDAIKALSTQIQTDRKLFE